ncbi:questin oxidase family protein [Kiloniella majae]|uniref:questin oxidase family protein n=1 Tax=Kiloniella majae TaxID=1938558 RepID=UPI000A278950|nr:questin oxidase family protein [Kiloniella majae]
MTKSHAEVYAPEYGPSHFSNHSPMASFALKRLGGSEQQLQDFKSGSLKYLERNSSERTVVEITDDNFETLLGKRQNYLGYFAYFKKHVGIGKTLPKLDFLAKGVSASAFHALIRTAYGIDAQDVSEVAAGLAYWADSHLVVVPDNTAEDSPSGDTAADLGAEILAKKLDGQLEPLPSNEAIFGQMRINAEDEVRQSYVLRAFNVTDLSLDPLRQLSLTIFLQTNNFTALHTVTASHAARLVLPYIDDQATFLRQLCSGVIAAILTIPNGDFTANDWSHKYTRLTVEELKKRGVSATDSHDIKFVYSCLEEYRHYDDVRYLDAASCWLSK